MSRITLVLLASILLAASSLHCGKSVSSSRVITALTFTPVKTDLPDEELAILDWRDCVSGPTCIRVIDGHTHPGWTEPFTGYTRARLLPGRHRLAYTDGPIRNTDDFTDPDEVSGVVVLNLEAGHFYRVRSKSYNRGTMFIFTIKDETTGEVLYRKNRPV